MGWLSDFLSGLRDGAKSQQPAPAERPLRSSIEPSPGCLPKAGHIQWQSGSFPTAVVGENNYQRAMMAECSSHTRYGVQHECLATVLPEPGNRFDANAVEVLIQEQHVGFLSREEAPRMKEGLEAFGLAPATCGARITQDGRQTSTTKVTSAFGWPFLAGIRSTSATAWPTGRSDNGRRRSDRRARSLAGQGSLLGRRIAFMGAYQSNLPEELAALGATIVGGVRKTTTDLIIVGGEPPFPLGARRSPSFEIAKDAAASGQPIRICGEDEFRKALAAS